MTKEDIIKKISERNGDNSDAINANLYNIEKELGRENADIWLRGWLTFPETLKAVFGEKDYWYETDCTCGGAGIHINDDVHDMSCARVKSKRGYIYHGRQISELDTNEAILQYYELYL